MKPYTGDNRFITILTYVAIVITIASIVLEMYFSQTIKLNLHRMMILLCVIIPIAVFTILFNLLFGFLYKKYLWKIDRKI